MAGGLGAEEEYEWGASAFVECEEVLGGQFLMPIRRGGGSVLGVNACLLAANYWLFPLRQDTWRLVIL